jgi:predicted transcriptional regulator
MTTFPETLRTIRRRYRVTQGDLARWSGLHRASVNRLERGWYVPTREHVEALIAALGPTGEEAAELRSAAPVSTIHRRRIPDAAGTGVGW